MSGAERERYVVVLYDSGLEVEELIEIATGASNSRLRLEERGAHARARFLPGVPGGHHPSHYQRRGSCSLRLISAPTPFLAITQ